VHARLQIVRDLEKAPAAVNLQDELYIKKAADRMPDVVRAFSRLARRL
jgi:hypothetical protein